MNLPDNPTFTQAIEHFLMSKRTQLTIQRGANPTHTIKDYRYNLLRFLRWFCHFSGRTDNKLSRLKTASNPPEIEGKILESVLLEEITQDIIESYLVDCTRAEKSVHTVSVWLYTLKSFYKTLNKRSKGKIDDITNDIKRQQFTYQKRAHLQMAHAQKYINHVWSMKEDDPLIFRNKLFLLTVLKFGLRMSEALKITEKSLSFSEDVLTIHVDGKRQKKRSLPLPLFESNLSPEGALVPIKTNVDFNDLLNRYLTSPDGLPHFKSTNPRNHIKGPIPNKGDWIFRSRRGVRLSYHQARLVFIHAITVLGIENFGYTPHSLRHTAITNSLFSGIDIETASQMYGNSPETITRVYSHSEKRKLIDGFSKAY